MKRSGILLFLGMTAALTVALAFRLPQLDARPFHGDEANQAMKTLVLLETGVYRYDPHEHHGPTLYYGALPLLWVFAGGDADSTPDWVFRLLPVFAGTLLVLSVLLFPALRPGERVLAALLMALSTPLVYYSRYFIQEILLVLFAFVTFAAVLQCIRKPGWGWALLAGVGAGLTHATKETGVLLFAAMGAALLLTWGLARLRGRHAALRIPPAKWIALAALAALGVAVLLFTSFFTHARGPLDSLLTYGNYLTRAEGQGSVALHDKPWHYYFGLLAYTYRSAGPRWTEAFPMLLALTGLGVAFWPKADPNRWPVQALALYTLIVAAGFSLIPYKTPWNLLPFWQPALVLAGIGGMALFPRTRNSWTTWATTAVGAAVLAAGMAHGARQCYQANFVYAADIRTPWVYAHTSTALMRLVQRVEDLRATQPGQPLHINVIKPDADYWPLPWYLRSFERVGYWTTPPEHADADIIIADDRLGDFVQDHISGEYQFEFHALRPGVNLLVFIRKPLWDAFMETRR